jgi:glutathione-independent formaldehyde dehydrogenase
MPGNRGVAYLGPGRVEVRETDYPEFELMDGPGVNPANVGRKLPHAAILKTVATNICGSDQHMVRGRTTAPEGLILGHEITGEVVETGSDVEYIKEGDLCSVPFNPTGPARRTATSTWAAGSAARPSTCSCRTPTGTC